MGFEQLLQAATNRDEMAMPGARDRFLVDLNKQWHSGRAQADEAMNTDRANWELGQHAFPGNFGYLAPDYKPPVFRGGPADGTTNHTGYMLDAILRDHALQQYDQAAKRHPLLAPK